MLLIFRRTGCVPFVGDSDGRKIILYLVIVKV